MVDTVSSSRKVVCGTACALILSTLFMVSAGAFSTSYVEKISSRYANEIPRTSRVTQKGFDSSVCTAPASRWSTTPAPLIVLHSQCPCFIRYIINSHVTANWDVFITPRASYEAWKLKNFTVRPTPILTKYSTLNTTVKEEQLLKSPEMNAYMKGNFSIIVRAITSEPRQICLVNPQDSISTSIVFEPMPTACPIMVDDEKILSSINNLQNRSTILSHSNKWRSRKGLKRMRVLREGSMTVSHPSRIVGGVHVNQTNSPTLLAWTAVIWLLSPSTPLCGGVHIAPGYIATAAHCQIQNNPTAFGVRVGELQADSGRLYRVRRAYVHPDYRVLQSKEAENDVCILELTEEPDKPTIKLNHNSSIPVAGHYVTTAGYGYISEGWVGFPVPNKLRRVDVPVVDGTECKKLYQRLSSEIQICAGYTTGGCDSCLSDSGGPLRVLDENVEGGELLVGLVSFGSGCARANSPGVYTRISAVSTWIEKTVESAKESRSRQWVWWVAGGVAGFVGGVVIVGTVIMVRRAIRGRRNGEEVRESQASDLPSMTGISA